MSFLSGYFKILGGSIAVAGGIVLCLLPGGVPGGVIAIGLGIGVIADGVKDVEKSKETVPIDSAEKPPEKPPEKQPEKPHKKSIDAGHAKKDTDWTHDNDGYALSHDHDLCSGVNHADAIINDCLFS